MASFEIQGLDQPSSSPSSPKSGGGEGRGAGGRAMDTDGSSRRRHAPSRGTTVRQIHEQYETSPFAVWYGMVTKLLGSAFATAGIAIATALYPVYALTPSPLLDALSRGLFNVGYLIYMSALGRWMHLRLVRSMRQARQQPHSRGIRPSVLSSCSILPIPFLNDNYSYLLVMNPRP